jgi:hypothetical protein
MVREHHRGQPYPLHKKESDMRNATATLRQFDLAALRDAADEAHDPTEADAWAQFAAATRVLHDAASDALTLDVESAAERWAAAAFEFGVRTGLAAHAAPTDASVPAIIERATTPLGRLYGTVTVDDDGIVCNVPPLNAKR